MEEVTKSEGRTILFVSHNLAAIQRLCNKTILLEHGNIKDIGETSEVIEKYLNSAPASTIKNSNLVLEQRNNIDHISITTIQITDADGSPLIHSHSKLSIEASYTSNQNKQLSDIRALISIFSQRSGQMAFRLDSHVSSETLPDHISPCGTIVINTGAINLVEGSYRIEVAFYPQETKGYVKTSTYFDVVTDNAHFNFRQNPDKDITDHLIGANFKAVSATK